MHTKGDPNCDNCKGSGEFGEGVEAPCSCVFVLEARRALELERLPVDAKPFYEEEPWQDPLEDLLLDAAVELERAGLPTLSRAVELARASIPPALARQAFCLETLDGVLAASSDLATRVRALSAEVSSDAAQ